jgi:hypothetical protein
MQRTRGLGRRAGDVPYKGDASNPTEVHAVIQQAFNDTPALSEGGDGNSRGGRVHFKPGDYIIGKDPDYFQSGTGLIRKPTPGPYKDVHNDNFLEITGEGWGTYIQRADNIDEDLIYVEEPGSSQAMGPHIRDIRLYGNRANNASGSGVVVGNEGGDIRELTIDHTLIVEHPDDGVNATKNRSALRNTSNVEDNGNHGAVDVSIIQGSECFGNDNRGATGVQYVAASRANQNGTDGFVLDDNNSAIIGGKASNNGRHGISLVNAVDARAIGVGAANNGGYGYFIKRGTSQSVIGTAEGNTSGEYTLDGNGDLPFIWINGAPAKVYLSAETGSEDGQIVLADGTSSAAAGAVANWNESSSVWNYVDPTGTV